MWRLTSVALIALLSLGNGEIQSQPPPPAPGETSRPQKSHAKKFDQKTNPQDDKSIKTPLSVTLDSPITIEKSDRDREEERQESDKKAASDGNLVTWTAVLAVTTGILALITGFLARYTYKLWKITNASVTQQATDMQASLTIAQQSAGAAIDSAGTSRISMIASGRAYVHFNGCRWVSHPHIADGHIFWRVSVNWINSGNTPTRELQVYSRFELRDNALPLNVKFARDTQKPPPVTIYPKGTIGVGGWDITGTDLVAVSEARKYLYVWGIAVYRDVFPNTKEHVTKFCVVATNLTGDPLKPWHADTNPFNITFANYHQHNCADEDCDDGQEKA